MIAKVFRQADTEETGHVDTARVSELAGAVFGSSIKDNERHLIKYHVDSRAGAQDK